MRIKRVTKEEILAALRKEGNSSLEEVRTLVIEAESSLTVIEAKKDVVTRVLEAVKK